MSPAHYVWPRLYKLVANFGGVSESSRQHGHVGVVRKWQLSIELTARGTCLGGGWEPGACVTLHSAPSPCRDG